MRSNKLISMLAMATVMVGCSQEELLTVDNQQLASNNLANRPVIESVEFGLGEVESRMALKDGSALNLVFEEGDKVGAALIDEAKDVAVAGKDLTANGGADCSAYTWTYQQYLDNNRYGSSPNWIYYTTAGLTAKDFYEVTEKIYTNYPFTRNADGKFESEANMVEGGYMFYMPYDATHLNRTRIEAVLPQVQDCSDDVMRETTWKSSEKIQVSSTALSQFYAGEMEGFEGAPVLAGYKFLEAPKDGSLIKPVVEMNHLYAYPMITIKNDFNGFFINETTKATATTRATATMTIDSVQVYYAGAATDPYFYHAPIKSAAISTELAKDGTWEDSKLQEGAPTADLLDAATTDVYPHKNMGTDATKLPGANIAPLTKRVTMVVGKELANGESYSFHAILPAGSYDDDLTARVYVTIDGKRYVILNATSNPTSSNNVITRYDVDATTVTNYAFISRGGNGLELVRGEHFPKAEINVDEDGNKSRKAFAGEALTISFKGTVDNSGVYTGGTAFALSETTVTNYYGITSNEDFIEYLNDWVGRGKTLTETPANATAVRENWAEGSFAFAPTNTVVINAELIKGLKKHTDIGEGIAKLVLKANLPIASDVKIAAISGDVYTFETLDADKVSYKIDMSGVTFHTNAAQLQAGINKIAAAAELKTKAGQSNIVVILANGGTVTANTVNVSSIILQAGTLQVNAACNALVDAQAGTIAIGPNGALTNTNNVIKNITVTNNSARTIAGTLTDVTVEASYDAAWPTTAIPAASKINKVTINTATGIDEIAIEQAQVDMFAGLTNVDVVLGDNITKIKTTANVTLTNIKSITATTSAQWYSTNNGIIVTTYQWGTATQKTTTGNITPGAGITIQ